MRPAEIFLRELKEAVEGLEIETVGELIDAVDPNGFSPEQVRKTLDTLRKKRLFPEIEKAAALLAFAHPDLPVIQRQWAQALIDQGRVPQALRILEITRARVTDDPGEGAEVRGLIGRARKQRYVEAGEAEDLRAAIATYREPWRESSENRWHGINLVALIERARRDDVDPGVADDAPAIAREILAAVQAVDEPDAWDLATGMEAAVALGDQDNALRWARRYVRRPDADAFEIASTLRQLREIWQLQGTSLGGLLIPPLESALLLREEGGSTRLSPGRPKEDGFEAVYGAEGYHRFEWLDTLYRRAEGVGKIAETATGRPSGTGFVVRFGDLHPPFDDRPLLVTNSHVLSDDPADEAPLGSGRASVTFTRLPGSPRVPIGPIRFSSRRVDLDVTICEIEPPDGLEPLPLTPYCPVLSPDSGADGQDPESHQRIYVIGHPLGGDLVVSLYDNDLAGYEGRYVRYRSPTDQGNSGSPVLNRTWTTFAVHHKAVEASKVNEGVLLEAILAALPGV